MYTRDAMRWIKGRKLLGMAGADRNSLVMINKKIARRITIPTMATIWILHGRVRGSWVCTGSGAHSTIFRQTGIRFPR